MRSSGIDAQRLFAIQRVTTRKSGLFNYPSCQRCCLRYNCRCHGGFPSVSTSFHSLWSNGRDYFVQWIREHHNDRSNKCYRKLPGSVDATHFCIQLWDSLCWLVLPYCLVDLTNILDRKLYTTQLQVQQGYHEFHGDFQRASV